MVSQKRVFCWFLLVAAIVTVSSYLSFHYLTHKTHDNYFWGIFSASTVLSLAYLAEISKHATKALHFIKKYTVKNSFKGSLGLQAEIQEELVHLLRIWIPSSRLSKRKIILVVEDIDRCSEEKIIANVDALRVMLEDEEITKRLLIITAIDERILRDAITTKYTQHARFRSLNFDGRLKAQERKNLHSEIQQLVTEYMDKLFICAIKLGALSVDQKTEFLQQLLTGDIEEQERVQERLLSFEETPPQMRGTVLPAVEVIGGNLPMANTALPSAIQGKENVVVASGPIPRADWAKLNAAEIALISATVGGWANATPRKISIFYYRYLLCKNFLIGQYEAAGRQNQWRDRQSVDAVLQILHYFGEGHREEIAIVIEQLRQVDPGIPKLPGLEQCGQKSADDYQKLLEAMELIVAY
jgi:hypothetical protein